MTRSLQPQRLLSSPTGAHAPDDAALLHAGEAGFRAALRAGLSEHDARDLAQEALLRALSSTPPPDGVALAAWVYGIARNLCRDHAKSARIRLVVDVPDAEADAQDPDLAVQLAVRRAVHALPDPLRDVLTLHELEEHTLRDTALALDIPFDTAKDRLRRARECLRVDLADGDRAIASERTAARRRAAKHGAAIGAATLALLSRGGVASAATADTAPSPSGGAWTGIRAYTLVAACVTSLAAGVVIGRLTVTTPPHSVTALPPAPVALAAADDAAPAPSPDEDVESAPEPPAARPSRPVAATRAPDAAPAEKLQAPSTAPAIASEAERLLLDRARSGLQRGLTDEALIALMSHERQFPMGILSEERDVLLIEAYLHAQRIELAKQRIARYRARHPAGALCARVEALTGETVCR